MSVLRLNVVLGLLWGAAVAGLLTAGWFLVISTDRDQFGTVDFGRGDYRLQRHDGGEFTQQSLVGRPSLVFFGFTFCPDVCPTTLGDIMTWQTELGERARDLQVVFVTVDPARDSAEVLSTYIGWLPGAVGVTGSQAQTEAAMRAFRVFASKVPGSDGDYTMDHSSSVQLFDDRGRFVTHISYQAPLDEALGRLEQILP